LNLDNHEFWMKLALTEAETAMQRNEIPVGAVLVKNNQLVCKEHNRTRELNTHLAHAEMLIFQYIQTKEKFLHDYTLYVTLEPCLMCAGAIILSRLSRLVFGTFDPKTGVCGSVYNVLTDKNFNHKPIVISGIMQAECSILLKEFFKGKR